MITGNLQNVEAIRSKTAWRTLLPFSLTLIFAMSFWPARTQAQIVGDLKVEVPFEFHAGNTTLPAGSYVIHQVNDSNLTVMEISRADGKRSALFNVESAQAKTTPEKTQLIFNKYGDQYFLSELFDAGDVDGTRLVPSAAEKGASKDSDAELESVAAAHPSQQGK
jgi:hypothetical protein